MFNVKTRILKETLQNGNIQYHPQWRSWESLWFWKDFIEEQNAVAGATIRWHLYSETLEGAIEIIQKFLHPKVENNPNKIINIEVIK